MIEVIDKRVSKWVEKHFPCMGAKQCENWGLGNPKHINGCPAKHRNRATTLAYEVLRATKNGGK